MLQMAAAMVFRCVRARHDGGCRTLACGALGYKLKTLASSRGQSSRLLSMSCRAGQRGGPWWQRQIQL